MFKYQEEISKLISLCPPPSWKSQEITAFRFVFEETHLNYKNNFLPVLTIQPKRKLSPDDRRCEGYALSLFDTAENAQKHYYKITNKRPHLRENLGSYLAEVFIEDKDGVVSKIDKKGHFNLHEYKNADLSKKYRVISPL